MNPDESLDQNLEHPVAYDVSGKPLYARPVAMPKTTTKTTHPSKSGKKVISPETKARHEQSLRDYPYLNLSESEYVIDAVRRHPIGLIIPLAIGAILLVLTWALLSNYAAFAAYFNFSGVAADPGAVMLPGIFLMILIALGMIVVFYVYVSNKFFLTNESVIQEIQTTLFSKLEQTVGLMNIEDASFTQHGILQYLFNYGSIRLSTEGDETTYRFTYVSNPKVHIATINNTIEAYKKAHPDEPNEQ